MRIILLAFANSNSSPLNFLEDEEEKLREILRERNEMGDFEIHIKSATTPETINEFLKEHNDDLVIFQFSGHAGRDRLLLGDEPMFSNGIAKQLSQCPRLKLVVLNGCSTAGQVISLLENNVPVVVSTSAPVEDKSAKEFSIRFWHNLVKDEQTIEDAFEDALAVAESINGMDLESSYKRHLFSDGGYEAIGEDTPIWRLDCIDPNNVHRNPVPYKLHTPLELQKPNEVLIETLFDSFFKAENPKIVELRDKELNGVEVKDYDKQVAIVNSIPFPIGIHLTKLICPFAGTDDEGYDEFGIRRLNQIAQFYSITTEFLGIIMVAQIWELFIRFPEEVKLTEKVKDKLNEYLELNENRELYDYIPLIQEIRKYIEEFQSSNNELKSFIDEQEILKDLFRFDIEFQEACSYLTNLRRQTINKKIDEDRLQYIYQKTERMLCIFVKPLGFIHRYHLTSVQEIDVLKLRHISKLNTEYKHRIVKCMHSIGQDELNYYYMKTFLDSWGVILLKCDFKRIGKKKFQVDVKDYLNLSPFMIDKNSFVDKADLANIMFFKNESDSNIYYKSVKKPLELRDGYEILKDINIEDNFESIRVQLNAFREFIA